MKKVLRSFKTDSMTELSMEQLLMIKGGYDPWANAMDENNPWIEGEG